MTGRRLAVALFLGLVLLAGIGDAFAQCAMCRNALESPEGARLAQAFRSAILLLLPVPFLAVTTITILILRARRRLRLQDPPPYPSPK